MQLKKLQKDNETFIREQQHLLTKKYKEIKQLTTDSMKETKQQQRLVTLLEEKDKEIEQLKTDNKKDRNEDKLFRAQIEKELMEAKNLIKQMMQRESETRPDTRLPKSRAGGQGPYSRSVDYLGRSSMVQK